MPSSDDLPAVIGAGRRRHGVLASPAAAAPELDALATAPPPRPRARLPLPPPAWSAAGLYVPALAGGGRREDELSLMIRGSKGSREHDRELTDRLAEAVARAFPRLVPELVVSVPERPGEEDRFRYIRAGLAARLGAADGWAALCQTRVVEGYRELTTPERRTCCAGRFGADDRVRDRSVLLVDDVVTSGAQASEAIRAPRAAGARSVRFAAVAIAVAAPEDAHDLARVRGLDTDAPSHTMVS